MVPQIPITIAARWTGEQNDRVLKIEALPAEQFSDALESSPGGGGGMAAVTQEFLIGGLRLQYRSADGAAYETTAKFDPRQGNIDAPSKERHDFVGTTFLSARAYSSMIHDARQFSHLLKIKREQDVLDAMQVIEPRIQRLVVLSDPGGPVVYVDLGLAALVPLAVCGEGFVRLFSIVVELTASRGGVLLIDEIDNGLHHSVMEKLWSILRTLADQYDVQVFGTTHNEEIIFSALRAFKDDASDLGLVRIDYRDGQHCATVYDPLAMQAVLEEHFEVRG